MGAHMQIFFADFDEMEIEEGAQKSFELSIDFVHVRLHLTELEQRAAEECVQQTKE